MNIKLKNKPMCWAWFFVALWGAHSAYTLFAGRWTGLVISLIGLVGALLIVSAFQTRRHKNLHAHPEPHLEGMN